MPTWQLCRDCEAVVCTLVVQQCRAAARPTVGGLAMQLVCHKGARAPQGLACSGLLQADHLLSPQCVTDLTLMDTGDQVWRHVD